MHTLYLDLYGIHLHLKTSSQDILDRLTNDFSYFKSSKFHQKAVFLIEVIFNAPPYGKIPSLKATSQSLNSITYDDGDLRYNDYYGEALSVYDYKTDKAEIYSLNINRLHEIAYLLILSRTGEALDKKGFHKIHASGISHMGRAFIMMMPMKGGKSTTFLNLLEQPEFEIISDDTPLINSSGVIYPFPLRLGIHKIPDHLVIDSRYISEIKRELYGEKFLISMLAFRNQISKPCSKVVLLNGVRYSSNNTQIVRCSKIAMIRPLMVHMVIGLGLPIILEYFLRFSFLDICAKTKIFLIRLKAALVLILKADLYTLELGQDQKLASNQLTQFILEYDN